MEASIATRRAFVGSALLGTALVLPLASPLRRGMPGAAMRPDPAAGDATAVAAAGAAGPLRLDAAGSMAQWAAAIGETFLMAGPMAGAAGPVRATLVAVEADRHDDTRPASLRAQSFWVQFSLAVADAPAGDALYRLDHPVAGRSDLFLMRSADQAGRAILKALFS